jgi:hypothetical protein
MDLDRSVVIVPDTDWPRAVVVYGGLYGWEGAWLIKQIPAALQSALLFVLPKHYTNDCAACLAEVDTRLKIPISSYALCGYSRGGIEVYRNMNLKPWKILGLIDPSAPTLGDFTDDVLDSVSSKVRCVYWVPNWGKTGYQGRVPRFAQHLRDLKVMMVEKATPHDVMPASFFQEFGKELLTM